MGGIIQGIGTAGVGIWQGVSEREAAQKEATATDQLLSYKQRETTLQGNIAAQKARIAGGQTVAAQRTGYANSGVDATMGTAANVQADTAAQSALDAQTIQNNAAREAWGYDLARQQNKVNLQTKLGSIDRQTAGSIISGAGQAMGGGASLMGSFGGGGSGGDSGGGGGG